MKKNSFVRSFYAARRKQKCFNYVYRLLKIVLDKVKTKKYSNHTKKNWAVILVIINQLSNKIIIKVLKYLKYGSLTKDFSTSGPCNNWLNDIFEILIRMRNVVQKTCYVWFLREKMERSNITNCICYSLKVGPWCISVIIKLLFKYNKKKLRRSCTI